MADPKLVRVSSEYLSSWDLEEFAVLVARVLTRLGERRNARVVDGPGDVAPAFQSAQRISDALSELAQELPASWESERKRAFLVCFSGALFPHRMNATMGAEERKVRFQEFRTRYPDLRKPGAAGLLPETQRELLCDLTAAGHAPAGPERDERIQGALLHLATRPAATIGRMAANWLDDREFVRFFREELWTPPSHLIHDDSRFPEWPAVHRNMQLLFPTRRDHSKAVSLEKMLWEVKPDDLPEDRFREYEKEFWERIHGNLISGFPYYDFSAHFFGWWRACVENFKNAMMRDWLAGPDEDGQGGAGQSVVAAPQDPVPPIFDLLALVRQCYRLIRATAHDAGSLNLDALDALWEWWVRRTFAPKEPRSTIEEIATEYGVKEAWASTWINRIELRVRAYVRARYGRFTNSQVWASLDDSERPLVPAWFLAVARAVPASYVSLWVLLSQVAWHQRVFRKYARPMTSEQCFNELRCWQNDPNFDTDLDAGASAGRLPDRVARDMLTTQWSNCNPTAAELVSVVEKLVGPHGTRVYLDWGAAREDAAITRKAKHWLGAIWYLLFVEKLETEEAILKRLAVDVSEVDTVQEAVHRMKNYEEARGGCAAKGGKRD